MQEVIQKTLCRPVNWFVGDKEFSKRAPDQILAVFLVLIVWMGFVLLLGFVNSLILIKSVLHIFSNEWAKGLGFFLFFLFVAFFTWWVCKIKIDTQYNHRNCRIFKQFKGEKTSEKPGKNRLRRD